MPQLESREPRRRPSMADVGRAADVSAQTVSRFFTGGYVSAGAREKIEAAVRELGYNRSRLPQILRQSRTETLGFLAMGPMNYGNSGILTGISRAARAAGQSLLITQFDVDPTDSPSAPEVTRALQNFLSMRVDGIVVATPYLGVGPLLGEVLDSVPVVSLSEGGGEGLITVHADSYGAARSAVRHLLEQGHREILHLAGPANRNESVERVRGYRDEVAAWDVGALPVVPCDEWDAASGAAAARTLDLEALDGVFSANDQIALGFMHEARAVGVTAPDHYSIVGIDDMPDCAYFMPPLTSSRLDFERVGELGLELILRRIAGESVPSVSVVPSVLSVRSSTATALPRGSRRR